MTPHGTAEVSEDLLWHSDSFVCVCVGMGVSGMCACVIESVCYGYVHDGDAGVTRMEVNGETDLRKKKLVSGRKDEW